MIKIITFIKAIILFIKEVIFVLKNWKKISLTNLLIRDGDIWILKDKSFFFGEKISYTDARKFIMFLSKKIPKNEKILVFLKNSPEIILSFLSIVKNGGVTILINQQTKSKELEKIIEKTSPKAIIFDEKTKGEVEKAKIKIEKILLEEIAKEWEKEKEKKDLEKEEEKGKREFQGNRDVLIFFTSGTTGEPKGAVIKRYSIERRYVKGAFLFSPIFRFIDTISHISPGITSLPLSHAFGFVASITQISLGLPFIFLESFSAKDFVDIIKEEKVGFILGVPAMFKLIVREIKERAEKEKKDFKGYINSVKVFMSGADTMPEEIIEDMRKATKRRIKSATFIEGYGMVETVGMITIRVYSDILRFKGQGGIGIPLPGTKIRVVKDGKIAKRGEVGELQVKGDTIKGYIEGEQPFTEDGWLKTGDLVKKGFFGFLWFQGREKDVIKVGGYSVFPAEVENEILRCPGVLDAVVFAVEDEIKGEKPAVAIIKKEGFEEKEIISWIKENIAPYKAPREIFFVENLPKTETMKAKRKELSKMFSTKKDM